MTRYCNRGGFDKSPRVFHNFNERTLHIQLPLWPSSVASRLMSQKVDGRVDGKMGICFSSSWHRHTRYNVRIFKCRTVSVCAALCAPSRPRSVAHGRTTAALASSIRSVTFWPQYWTFFVGGPHTSFVNPIAHTSKKQSGGLGQIPYFHWTRRHMVPRRISKAYGDVSAQAAIDLLPCLSQSGANNFFFCLVILWIGCLNVTAAAGSARASFHVVRPRL